MTDKRPALALRRVLTHHARSRYSQRSLGDDPAGTLAEADEIPASQARRIIRSLPKGMGWRHLKRYRSGGSGVAFLGGGVLFLGVRKGDAAIIATVIPYREGRHG